jgi:hypothetical protein
MSSSQLQGLWQPQVCLGLLRSICSDAETFLQFHLCRRAFLVLLRYHCGTLVHRQQCLTCFFSVYMYWGAVLALLQVTARLIAVCVLNMTHAPQRCRWMSLLPPYIINRTACMCVCFVTPPLELCCNLYSFGKLRRHLFRAGFEFAHASRS